MSTASEPRAVAASTPSPRVPPRRAGAVLASVLPGSESSRDRLRRLALLVLGGWLLWGGLVHAPGPHDNDWPLLMWLVKHASWRDPSPLAIGHYGPLQLLAAWWLYPLFGSTLAAAKVLSTLGVLASVACFYRMTRPHHGEAAASMAAVAIALSTPALETGQSEFADAPASALLFAGLCLWWGCETASGGRSTRWRALLAGVLMGTSGLLRTHFVVFSLASGVIAGSLALLLPAERTRRASALLGLLLLLGTVLGNLPGVALNLWVHGQPGSAVASTFIGQVLYGFDDLDLPSTYARHPLGQILRDHPRDLLRLMTTRAGEQLALWLVPLLAAAIALWNRRWPTLVRRHVLLFSALAFLYFWLFVSLAWVTLPRVTLPVVFIDCWLVVAVAVQLFWTTFRWGPLACCLGFALALPVEWSSSLRAVKDQWRTTRRWWRESTELVHALRQLGMQDAREAFVFDWNRFVVDDPELQPFYNFGYWNLLLPEFRAERPIPTRYLNDLEALSTFFERQEVKFFVLPRNSRRVARFPALVRLLEGKRELPGFRRGPELASDVLLVQAP